MPIGACRPGLFFLFFAREKTKQLQYNNLSVQGWGKGIPMVAEKKSKKRISTASCGEGKYSVKKNFFIPAGHEAVQVSI